MVSQVSGSSLFASQRAAAPRSGQQGQEESVQDSVSLGQERGTGIRLMAGAPTGFLSPQIPPPSTYVVPVGVEIAPGLGISLDGKAILVGHKGSAEKFDILGRLPDGTYPQRDFKVARDGANTVIDGHYNWQDYSLKHQGGTTVVKGETDRESFNVKESPLQTIGAFPAKTFSVTPQGEQVKVQAGYTDGPTYTLSQEGNTTRVDAGNEEVNFTFARQDDGSIKIDGKYTFQDFTITPREGGGWVVKGYYPQQKYEIRPS